MWSQLPNLHLDLESLFVASIIIKPEASLYGLSRITNVLNGRDLIKVESHGYTSDRLLEEQYVVLPFGKLKWVCCDHMPNLYHLHNVSMQ